MLPKTTSPRLPRCCCSLGSETGVLAPQALALCPCPRLGSMEPPEKQPKDFVAVVLEGRKCPPKKKGVTGRIMEHLQRTLQRPISWRLSSPVAFPQCCTGSCPNLMTSSSEARGEKPGEVVSAAPQPVRTSRSPRWSPSAGRDGPNSTARWGWRSGLGVQVEEADSRGPARSVGSLVLASLPCALRHSPSPPSLLPCPSPSPSEAKLASHFPFFSIPLPCTGRKKPHRESWKKKNPHPEEHPGPNPEEPACFSFAGPVIARITDCIYLGNLNAAYSGRVLCTNGIDSIIDVSSLPRDHSLSIIPCTCGRAGFRHSWPRLRVDIRASLHRGHHDIGQPCFLDINECIEASMEKGKRVLVHCRDGYSLGPTCVIQYLMVKHSMGLLAAYGFVRARYPLNIQECHQDLLVALEMSLQPGTASLACLKHSLSRKMAWS
ncbi:uncharacterized protein LOC118168551 isoform X2 [Oxyura jamaicensis]|uniref:uncharacterized protein LOC118168551 isoform X2 n=1 Tax=Oxyura jamaicensis TaxID=8884 RepID=UPI0015A6330D|nr:uncharacterized protein LOC118168551 isoform X2 [Oxyura jamaicensis]